MRHHSADLGSPNIGRTRPSGSRGRQARYSPASDDETDESLAQSVSKLDISSELCSASKSRIACSAASSSYSCSPLAEKSSGKVPGSSKRRSISDMSPAARMTPESMERRGLGVPWLRTSGLCTMELEPGDAGEQARQFCLIPTPELEDQRKRTPSPSSPDLRAASAMQQRFEDRVHRASLGQPSPTRIVTSPGFAADSPDAKDRRSLHEIVSPIAAMRDCSPHADGNPSTPDRSIVASGHVDPDSCLQPRPQRSVLPFSPTLRRIMGAPLGTLLPNGVPPLGKPNCSTSSPSQSSQRLHTARRMEDRLQLADSKGNSGSNRAPQPRCLFGASNTQAQVAKKSSARHPSLSSVKENDPPVAVGAALNSSSTLLSKLESRSGEEVSIARRAGGSAVHTTRSMSRSPPQACQRRKRFCP